MRYIDIWIGQCRPSGIPSVVLGGPFSRKEALKKIFELLCTVYSEATQESAGRIRTQKQTKKRKAIETVRGYKF